MEAPHQASAAVKVKKTKSLNQRENGWPICSLLSSVLHPAQKTNRRGGPPIDGIPEYNEENIRQKERNQERLIEKGYLQRRRGSLSIFDQHRFENAHVVESRNRGVQCANRRKPIETLVDH